MKLQSDCLSNNIIFKQFNNCLVLSNFLHTNCLKVKNSKTLNLITIKTIFIKDIKMATVENGHEETNGNGNGYDDFIADQEKGE